MRGHLWTPTVPAPVLLSGETCSMLGPAVNRQPGFRRETRRAKQRRKEEPCWLAGWLAGWLAVCLPGRLAASPLLAGWLTSSLTVSVNLAGSGWLSWADPSWLAA